MANWKIQDIAPPKRLKKEKEAREVPVVEKGRRKRRFFSGRVKSGVALFFVVLTVVFVGVLHVFFARADVALWPQTRIIKLLEPITAEVGGEGVNEEERIIPARILSTEKEGTRLFEASSKTIKENRASGTIRVFNAYTTSSQTLIAKTRFVSESSKLFRTPVRITIPGATQQGGKLIPGFLDIEVVAAEAGEDYNIGPSNFSLPGLSGSASFTAIYAESTESMTGGSEREVSVVSKEDIEKAKDSLIEELTQKAVEDLLGRVPEGMVASKDSVVVEVIEADSLVEAGAEIDQFSVSVSLIATAHLFSQVELDTLIEGFLLKELQEGERISADKTQIRFEEIVMQKGETEVFLELGITAVAYQYVDPTELKIKLRRKSKDEAANILSSYDAFGRVEISLWPFWIGSIPGNVDRIKILLFLDPAPNL